MYETVVTPVMPYRAETGTFRVKDERKLEGTKVRVVRWTMSASLMDHMKNEEVRRRVGVECINESKDK